MPASLCRAALDATAELDKLWGNARLGLTLSTAFYEGTMVTARNLAEFLDVSDDTVRRKLGELMNVGRAERRRRGRSVGYVATAAWATRTHVVLNDALMRTS